MAFDITGITNENEFYTHHYLSAILENDLKAVFREWKHKEDEEGVPQPYKRLRGLRKEFFAKQGLLERERSVEERLSLQREFVAQLLEGLGYEYHYQTVELDDNGSIPLAGGINRADGSPDLWIIEAANAYGEDGDPLESHFVPEQYQADDDIQKITDLPLEDIVTRQVFGRAEPPRWVILVNCTQVILLDRTKWHEKRLLRFDLREILDRRETTTLQAMAALLHRDSVCPEDGMPLLDTLDENSHKHAFSVSEDLKYSLREAIELLGNEAVYYLREQLHEKIYGRDMASRLTRECLRYMYRLLFLFYIEARPELGYLPHKSPEFRKGYSLESLRDLELVKLTTDESRNGFYIHDSIQSLFDLLYNGFQPKQMDIFGSPDYGTFRMAPLRSHLFDPLRTPLLKRVRFRNSVLQKIVELMSLSRPQKGRKKRRGRISYAQLGINQLGAVYEALLSYQGFFAETDLYEVKKAGEKHNVLETAYFIKTEDLEQYTEGERVYNDDGTLLKYDKGTFIYRLAGRSREKSASYYTQEVLTQCLVKYALKELLKDKTADEILELTVCEPAMGSAAFLNEAVNQLAKAYLDLKQKETGQAISHDDYPKELQKVKMYVADNNVYGVDLNPIAVELAEVSLWLNTIYKGGFVPWFGMQLVCGNSLIGARRQTFPETLLNKKQKTDPLWLDEVPERVMPGEKREKGTVYHFLLPDKGMADYKDKVIKQMASDDIKTISKWHKEFTKPFSGNEIRQLQKLSDAVDKLWQRHAEMQRDIDNRTSDPLYIFGQKKPKDKRQPTTTEFKDRIYQQEMFSQNIRNSSPYRRLKLIMDYWCVLWFWPIEKADMLPSRAEFLFDVSIVLEGNLFDADADEKGQQLLFPDTRPKQMSLNMLDELGYVNVDKLCAENKRLGLVKELSERHRYLHWELEFACLFENRRGFDLVLGNPPWIKLKWSELKILGETDPIIEIRNLAKNSYESYLEKRKDILKHKSVIDIYFEEYCGDTGIQNFLGSYSYYPELAGVQPNLYKCFFIIGSKLLRSNGVGGLLHDKGIYDDPNGKKLRKFLYHRLKYYFRFYNQLNYFSEDVLGHAGEFCITVFTDYKGPEINAYGIFNLISHKTIDNCFSISDFNIYSMKDDKGNWEIRGNRNRVITINKKYLQTCSMFIEEEGTPYDESKIAIMHSASLVDVIIQLANFPKTIESFSNEIATTQLFDEKGAVTRGLIERRVAYPKDKDHFIVSGPHYYVLNPFAKCPNKDAKSKGDYSSIDLENLPFEYIPRGIFQTKKPLNSCLSSAPKLSSTIVTSFPRLICRKMAQPSNERTLIPTLIPEGFLHTNGTFSLCHPDPKFISLLVGCSGTIIFDFIIRITGRSNILFDTIKCLPVLEKYLDEIIVRALRLTCLTSSYSTIWAECWTKKFIYDDWMGGDNSKLNFNLTKYSDLTENLKFNYGFRTYYQRRQGQLELDVLVAKNLNFTLFDLKSLYKVQFPTLNNNENNTWYDRNGRIVFTTNRNLSRVGLPRKATKIDPIGWEDIKDLKTGIVKRTIIDNTIQGGPIERTITFEAPFNRCDREKDYEVVWAEFERRFKEQEGNV